MVKIIGHRGARGVELENSLASIRVGLESCADGIEFDVHRTSDGHLVVMHDSTTGRVADQNVRISETSLEDLKKLRLKNGQSIPMLEDVLRIAPPDKMLCIDVKGRGCAEALAKMTAKFPETDIYFACCDVDELQKIHERLPKYPTYLYQLKRQGPPRPFHHVHEAKRIGATGIGVLKEYMNPLIYWLARRAGLEIYVASANTPFGARVLHALYPHVDICTPEPDRIAKALGR